MDPVKKHKIFIINRPGSYLYSIPLLWVSAKTYYEEHSKYSNLWEWGIPNLDYDDATQLLDYLVDQNPTVVGFSLYIWNEAFSFDLAKKLKQCLPEVIILWGGPQSDIHYNEDFFKKYEFIDIVFPSDAYGEQSFIDTLDNISKNNGKLNASDIQYCYYPDANRNREFNSLSPKKREFKWPKNPYRAQHQYMAPFIEQLTNKRSWLIVETSRGCPYKCSFCDWGGGTYTKTVKKDFATVLDEISWAGENQIDAISFTDANFGIFNIDLEYIKHCVETKKIYDYPKQILIQPTKTKIDQLTKIYMLLAENDMLSHYQIAIQDINDDVKKNVDRIDFPFEDQVNMFKKLQEKKYFPIWIESIIGLPGSSIDTVKEGIQRISLVELSYPLSHHWVMLPATPAAAPTYRKKFKLITVHGKSSIGVGTTRLINAKPGRQQDPGVSVAVSGDEITGEYVVGTFSYTSNDWVDMNLLQIFTATTQNGNILSTIADYMWNIHNTHYGDFFYTCLHTILFDTSTDPNLQKNFNILKLKFQEWLQTDCPDLFVDFHNELNFTIAPSIYYVLITLLDSKSFFNTIRIAIAKLVPMDEKIEDLCYFSQQRLLDIDYTVGRTFTTQYDWPKYIELGILDKTVKSFELADTQIQTGGRWFDIDWNQYQGVDRQKQFIYRVCFDFKGTKISRQIKEMPKN